MRDRQENRNDILCKPAVGHRIYLIQPLARVHLHERGLPVIDLGEGRRHLVVEVPSPQIEYCSGRRKKTRGVMQKKLNYIEVSKGQFSLWGHAEVIIASHSPPPPPRSLSYIRA